MDKKRTFMIYSMDFKLTETLISWMCFLVTISVAYYNVSPSDQYSSVNSPNSFSALR